MEKKESSRWHMLSIESPTARSTATARYTVCNGTATVLTTIHGSRQNTRRNNLSRIMSSARGKRDGRIGGKEKEAEARNIGEIWTSEWGQTFSVELSTRKPVTIVVMM